MGIVQFPGAVQIAIDALPSGPQSAAVASRLSARYRSPDGGAILHDVKGRLAYAAARMPGTYAAILTAAQKLAATRPDLRLQTLLDIGCGPGTASLAAAEAFGELSQVTQSDLDPGWRPVAATLGAATGHPALVHPRWLSGDLGRTLFPAHDLVMAGYCLNELPEDQLAASVRNVWAAAGQALILVEPGTPRGFAVIRHAREILIGLGAHLTAPCAHDAVCPIAGRDWCHFSVRVARSAKHRQLKQARLPYEDEKFSYAAFTRTPAPDRPAARIVKRPVSHAGHVTLDLCTEDGLSRSIVSRRDGALYKAARGADWGDAWPPPAD
jgi:ribosomal protein RSM22 (predicted rRNA methylase)